jgi:hypothetical protein
MENLAEALAIGGLLCGFVLIVFIIAKYTYLIKKAMIEKGLTTSHPNIKLKYLDIGCIIIGLGVGLMVSSIFTRIEISEDTMDLLVWGTILIFGGFSLIIAHFIRRKLEK